MSQTPNNLATESWAIADLLRGYFKQSQYGRIILPFVLLRRLECVLADSKGAVLKANEKIAKDVSEEAAEKLLKRATNRVNFYNTFEDGFIQIGRIRNTSQSHFCAS